MLQQTGRPGMMSAADAQAQVKELATFGNARARELGATGLTKDLTVGYQLGLATARAILYQCGAIHSKGLDPTEIL